jgi:hypothetical protein
MVFIFRLITSDAQPHLFGGVEICGCIIVGSQLGHQSKMKIGWLGMCSKYADKEA